MSESKSRLFGLQNSAQSELSPIAATESDRHHEQPSLNDAEKFVESATSVEPVEEEGTQYPNAASLALITLALYFAVFLVALDRTIIATAIPRITDDFNSLGDIGWYGSAYLLSMCASQLSYGTVYRNHSTKWVFFIMIFIFEVGSALCGAAPNSSALIVGRAIAGLGSSGIMVGGVQIVTVTVPLRRRPMYIGLFGGLFGIASVAGPLLGGVFTSKVSWRWCFYINLPIGGVAMFIIAVFLKLPSQEKAKLSISQQLAQLDPLGFCCLVPSVVSLLLALQWGGSTYAWSDGRIIALLVLFPILFSAFIAVQVWKGELATVPPRIIKQRSITAGVSFAFCVGSAMMVMVYYLPIWFQAIKGVSPVKSGIMSLPMLLGLVVASISAGGLVTAIGYYAPFMILSAVLASIGLGLMTTFKVDTGHAKWIGYQFLFGWGLGLGMQQPNIAAQTVLPKQDVPTGSALMFFAQALGGAVCISIAQNVFTNRLLAGLQSHSSINRAAIVHIGATDLRHFFSAEDLGVVLVAYNNALTRAFIVALAAACFFIVGALTMEWRSVKGKRPGQSDAKA